MCLLYICLLVLVIFHLLWIYCSKNKIRNFCKYQSGPKSYPFFGSLPFLYKTSILQGLISLKDKFSLPVNFWIYNDYYYITDRPEEIKILFGNTNKSFDKAPFYDDLIKQFFADTFLMTSSKEVNKWKHERKTVQKPFSQSMWKYYMPVFNRKSMEMMDGLEKTNNFQALFKYTSYIVFDVFLENFVDITRYSGKTELMEIMLELQERLIKRSALGRIVPQCFFKRYMKEGQRIVYLMNEFKSRIEEFIQQKRVQFQTTNEYVLDTGKMKLIEMLLHGEETRYSNAEIYKQLFLINLTSVETTALALIYTLVQLGMNPDIQEKVYEEIIREVIDKEEIETEDLCKLKYVEQAVFEAIRIFPVIPLVGRHVTQDISIGSKIMPKGCNVMILPYLVHRNETYWPDPEKYNPDRFSNRNDIQPGSYIPFLIGPRDCIGRYYSMAQVKVMLVNILKHYQIRVEPRSAKELKFELYIVMKPAINFDIQFIRRDEAYVK